MTKRVILMDKKVKDLIHKYKVTDEQLAEMIEARHAEEPPAEEEENEEEDTAEEPPASQEKAKPQTGNKVSIADFRKMIKEEISEALKPTPKPGVVKPEPKNSPLPANKPKPLGKLGEIELIM